MRKSGCGLGKVCGVLAGLLLASILSAQEPAAIAPGSTAFYRELLDKEAATFGDGCHVVHTLLAGQDVPVDFDLTVAALRDAGVLPREAKAWIVPDAPLTKGCLARMFCRALGIRGGLMRRILPGSARYAYKECLALGFMESGGERQKLSGAEVISVLSLCQEWREARRGNGG